MADLNAFQEDLRKLLNDFLDSTRIHDLEGRLETGIREFGEDMHALIAKLAGVEVVNPPPAADPGVGVAGQAPATGNVDGTVAPNASSDSATSNASSLSASSSTGSSK